MSVNHKQQFNRLYFFLVLAITAIILFVTLRVRRVVCFQTETDGQQLAGVCQDLNQAFLGKSLLFYNFAEASVWSELSQKAEYQQLYQLASLKKTPPSNLILNLDSRLPDYRLVLIDDNKQQQIFILNQNNHLKKDQLQNAIFEVIYQGQEPILEKNQRYLNEDYHQFFLALKNQLDLYQIPAKRLIWQNDDRLELDLGKSWLVILDKYIDPEETIKNLSLILADEEVVGEIKTQNFLDMRFRLPVIRERIE